MCSLSLCFFLSLSKSASFSYSKLAVLRPIRQTIQRVAVTSFMLVFALSWGNAYAMAPHWLEITSSGVISLESGKPGVQVTVKSKVSAPVAVQVKVATNSKWSASLDSESEKAWTQGDVTLVSLGATGTFDLFVSPLQEEATEGDVVKVVLHFVDPDGFREMVPKVLYFEVGPTALQELSYGDYLDRINIGTMEQPIIQSGGLVSIPQGVQSIDDLDGLSSAQLSALTTLMSEGLGTQNGGLSAATVDESGCAISHTTGIAPGLGGYVFLLLLLGLSVGGWRRVLRCPNCLVLVFVGTSLYVTSTASAETRWVVGYATFWDTRPRSDDTGSRYPTCDTADTDCNVTEADCCFSGIRDVTVSLRRGSMTGTVVDTSTTDDTGSFVLVDTAWQDVDYFLQVAFEREGEPFTTILTSQTGTVGFRVVIPDGFELLGPLTYIPNISINEARDTVSLAGDLASIWTSLTDTAYVLDGEGEVRYKHEYGSEEEFDLILVRQYDATNSTATCNTSTIVIDNGRERSDTPHHEFGHIAHGRVVGCAGGGMAFPSVSGGWDWTGSEGALWEATASLIRALAYWDPDTTPAASLDDWAECYVNTLDNTNDCSAARNNWRALYDFIDTPVGDGDSSYSDGVDITLEDVFDGMVVWQESDCEPGVNYSSCEHFWTNTQVPCLSTEACGQGEVCFNGVCQTGDVHGNNVRDWLHHIAANEGASETTYWQTLVQNLCVRSADDAYPFTLGYRSD